MTIHFELPKHIEEQLRSSGIDPTQAAKEPFFVDLYRKEQITHHQLAEALGLDCNETDGVLKRHGVGIECPRKNSVPRSIRCASYGDNDCRRLRHLPAALSPTSWHALPSYQPLSVFSVPLLSNTQLVLDIQAA